MDHFKHFYVISLLLLLFSIGCYSQSCSDKFIESGNNLYIKSIPFSFKQGESGSAADPCYPNPCKNGGTCKSIDDDEYTCECIEPFYGKNCSHTLVNPIYVSEVIESYVPESQFKYYTVFLPNQSPIYKNDSLFIQFKSSNSSCNYIVVDGKNVFFDEYMNDPIVNSTAKVHLLNSNATVNVTLSNISSGSVSISVFAHDDDCYSSILAASRDDVANYCVNGKFKNGVCICDKYWEGSNCDKFSLKLVFVLASVAGGFILGCAITVIIIRVFFTKRPSSDYEYNKIDQ